MLLFIAALVPKGMILFKMATVYDTDASKLINKAANLLKNEIKSPEWSKFVKTGMAKDRLPMDEDWWYKRAASILRKVYLLGPIGTSKLRVKYGSKKNRGYKPEKFYPASGKIIRVILQQLEKLGYISKEEKSIHKGRKITPKGKSFLDKLAK